MAKGIGIDIPDIPAEEQYYLQGVEPHLTYEGQRWIRLASLYPETVNFVDYYRDGELYYTSYDEPYPIHFKSNWRQGGVDIQSPDEKWTAIVHLNDGRVLELG